jgi:hypothetical protein
MTRRAPTAREYVVKVGGETRPISDGTFSNAVNDRANSRLKLDLRYLPGVDLAAPVIVYRPSAAVRANQNDGAWESDPQFTGHAVEAEPTSDGELQIVAESGRELVESRVGIFHSTGVPAIEGIHLIARRGGVAADRLKIEGLDELPVEIFIVEMPVVGLDVPRPVRAAEVEFLPAVEPGIGSCGPFTPLLEQIASRWGEPTARVRTYVSAQFLFDAQAYGARRIERALDGLLATAVYGFSRDPWGRDLRFDRSQLLARPAVVPVVFAQGLTTGRRVVETLRGSPLDTNLDLGRSFDRWTQVLSREPSDGLARALRALRDAADETRDVFERCHAISTVLEHYAKESTPDQVVSHESLKSAKGAVRALNLPPAERQRLLAAIGRVNNPYLLERVQVQLRRDGVPLSDVEWKLLKRLRSTRNDAVHGGDTSDDLPDDDELRWGLSVVARLLLFRWASEGARSRAPASTPGRVRFGA